MRRLVKGLIGVLVIGGAVIVRNPHDAFAIGAAATASLAMLGALLFVKRGSSPSRRLPPAVVAEITKLPEFRPGQHKVDFVLRDGRVIRGQYVAYGRDVFVAPWKRGPGYDFDEIEQVLPSG
jgi:hypothetical protein